MAIAESSPEARIGGKANRFAWVQRRPLSILALLYFSGMALPFILKPRAEWELVFLDAAEEMAAGQPLYTAHDGFVYPPFAAWVVMPFTFMPQLASRIAWYAINVLCMVCMFRWAWRLSGGGDLKSTATWPPREYVIAVMGTLSGGWFASNALAHHQTDLVIGALVFGGCVFLTKSRDVSAAVCFGLAAAIKGPALLWCPYLAWRRRWAASACVLAVAVGVNLLPNVFFAPPSGDLWLRDWLHDIVLAHGQPFAQAGWGYSDFTLNQSLGGTISRWFTTDWTWSADGVVVFPRPDALQYETIRKMIYAGTVLLLMAATLWAQGWTCPVFSRATPGEPQPAVLEFCMVLTLMLLLSPMSSKAHFGILILPAFCLVRLVVMRRDAVLAALVAAAFLGEMGSTRMLDEFAWVALWYGALSLATLMFFVATGYALRTCQATRLTLPRSLSEKGGHTHLSEVV
jgi:Glycosyltransferase family 87